MNILYFYIFLLAHPYLAMWWKSFDQANQPSWKALVPGLNYFIVFRLGAKKPWWSLLMIFPGVHLVMWAVANTSYIRRFGYFSLIDTVQGIFFPYIIMYKISQSGDKILPETNWANSKELGDREWGDHLALFLALPVIGHVIALGINAVTRHKPGKKTKVKEWGDSILFAVVAALIIRTYVFEPFQIPTGSMEKTLLVGDFLFVNKLAYGPKVPVTPLSYPLVHNTVPWVNIKSYSTIEKSDYIRLPGFTNINRYDVVVFNYPSGDTAVYDPRMPNGLMGHDYHQIVNDEALYYWKKNFRTKYPTAISTFEKAEFENVKVKLLQRLKITEKEIGQKIAVNKYNNLLSMEMDEAFLDQFGQDFIDNIESWKSKARNEIANGITYCRGGMSEEQPNSISHYGVVFRPVDKRENYIKRCVGVPGDILEIKSSVLYVNGKKAKVADNQNLLYHVSNFQNQKESVMFEEYGLENHRGGTERGDYYDSEVPGEIMMNLTESERAKLQKDFPNAVFTVDPEPQYSDDTIAPRVSEIIKNLGKFPKDLNINNTNTDFHKFQIPAAGQTIKINRDNIAWYRRIITAYEGHTLSEKKDGIYIDGKKTSSYTFKMNYYWMMGDNRYNSADSRVWGFVPEDHIVGKASMVWFSKDPMVGIRWDRIFTLIK